ncbi:hypothetical protein [Alteribacillus iranensis]|uniref:Copper amine oxidase N-terminal domain-containing protein n=1 Tax=Alteribacillus iranensis TaxID=930128 RepID=A0A1I2CXZ3_9BACI|nr:hypothetical protein [Alteribacillus iranensis]SFE72653.1 hypothetical protein SAMN05192532_103250 [Alteribacillus iranensis]
MKRIVRTIVAGGLILCTTWGTPAALATVPFQTELEREEEQQQEQADSGHSLYIDGQEQSYTGEPIFHQGVLYVTVPGAIQALNEKAEIDPTAPFADELSPYDYLEDNDFIESVNNREVVRVSHLQDLGVKAQWYDDPGRLHLETADLLTVDDLEVGDTISEVEEKVNIHWNTGYGQPADYIGFVGDMKEYTYTDRYGEERSGEVPELQLEIIDGLLTYIIISDESYETAKGITVGDSLFDVTRAHGSDYVKESVDGKIVYIYHVNHGSIWFIANENTREVERIGLWDTQLEGFER